MIQSQYSIALLLSIILTLCLGLSAGIPPQEAPKPDSTQWNGNFKEGWDRFEKLLKDQKEEAASTLVESMLAKARETKNSDEWTRSLVRYTALRISLHGYETAVRFLKEQPWPEDMKGSSVLNLFYAQALITYARSYSWEVNKREKVESTGTVDLKAWTRDQIYEEAQKAFENVWKNREKLGKLPVAEWKEYITPNTYPEGIRPTLRDAVSYLMVEMLADTNGWRPEELNGIYRLNLKELSEDYTGYVSLTAQDVHPLLKICFILADLENWHTREGNRAAALEARLERFRQLYDQFTEDGDREFIRNRLKDYLKPLADIPWWSEGMAQLAEFVQNADEPDSLIQAREIALQGEKAYSDSPGGRHCLSIVEQIEAPDYSLNGMRNDGPRKKSILVNHKNLERIYFRAYAIDLVETIKSSNDYRLLPSGRDLEALVKNKTPIREWDVPLPPTADYQSHKTFVVPPMTGPGTYLIAASARPGFPEKDNWIRGTYLTISDLVLVTRQRPDSLEVTVLSGSSGKPAGGADVDLYLTDYRTRHRKTASKRTDGQGIAEFPNSEDNFNFFLIARKEDQITYSLPQYRFRQTEQSDESSTLLYTDRSIYRPGQKIQWKAVAYSLHKDTNDYKTVPSKTISIRLRDANNQEVAAKIVTTNSFGTASGEFVIPAGRVLGSWHLDSTRGGQTDIQVEEYKRPTFEAKLLDPGTPLRLNRKAELKGEARYYFGLPVTTGQVRWEVRRDPVFPLWWWSFSRGFRPISSQSQVIAAGTEPLSENGTFSLTFMPAADERLADNKSISYRYSVSVDVTDEGGETRSAERAFQLGFTAVKADAIFNKGFFAENAPIEFNILRTSLDGIGKGGNGSWKIVALKQPPQTLLPVDQPLYTPPEFSRKEEYRTPGDRERERWDPNYNPGEVLTQWEDGPEQASGMLEHDADGKATVSTAGLPAGPYRVIYKTVDDFGQEYELRKEFIVAAASMPLHLPAYFSLETPSVTVGGTARFLVHSGIADQFMVFEVYRDGKCIQRKEIVSGQDPSLVEIPVTEEDRGGLGVALTLVRDSQFIRLGQSLMVPWDNKQLKVEFSTFRDRLRPGTKEKWSVRVTGPAGKDTTVASAELLAYMYDRSLDAFAPHSPVNPIVLFPNRSRSVQAAANLGAASTFWLESQGFKEIPVSPSFSRDRLLYYSGYGIGGVGGRMLVKGLVAEPREEAAFSLPNEIPAPPPPPPPGKRSKSVMLDAALSPAEAEYSRKESEAQIITKSGTGPAPEIELRSNFSETAFWKPHLLTGEDGSVSFEFEVPDSVTAWNVWVHAITRDLKSGSVHREAQTVKDLMVRPYLPRFLREGDLAQIKVVVNNASDHKLEGTLDFDIIDPATDKSLLADFGLSSSDASGKPFTVDAGGGSNLTFPIKTPSRVGQIAFKVTARSGDFSDGELRPIPILPGRMHLMQSRFVTLKDADRRVMRFEDLLKNDDPSRINEQMVVTLDAQLFYSVLSALPYLVNYPYECTEQTLNRFLSTGILSSLYTEYPAVEKMAREFSSRKTQYEQWNDNDPNRKMMLEETPWLQMAQGGTADTSDLIKVLDSRVAKAQQEASLAKLKDMQTSSGGFPWFPGGPPSPYMTLYLLNGFSRALEFGVDVPRDTVQKAWNYTHRYYLDDVVRDMVEHDCCWEFVTFINYVLSNYPDSTWYQGSFTPAERKTMLDFSFKHWREHSPLLKGYLSLTLKRMDRSKDAMLVWESVMDSAKTEKDQGTFWAPEDRAWLWYNDTIETHAFAVRTEMELIPDDPKLDGLVQWLFLNKKMNHWKSTRATAEVIYSLAHYLKATGQLGVREDATVTIGNQKTSFVFDPEKYTGKKTQIVIPGDKIDPATDSTITVEKTSKGYMFASAAWHFSTEKLPEEERGDYLRLSRSYFKRVHDGKEYTLQPLKEGAALQPGDEVEVHLSLTSKHPMEYVHLRDPRGAGFEPVSNISKYKWDLGIYWYEEIRDSGTNFFFENLPQGEYTFKYRIRAATAGTFKVAPATVQPMYAPEFAAYSTGAVLEIQ